MTLIDYVKIVVCSIGLTLGNSSFAISKIMSCKIGDGDPADETYWLYENASGNPVSVKRRYLGEWYAYCQEESHQMTFGSKSVRCENKTSGDYVVIDFLLERFYVKTNTMIHPRAYLCDTVTEKPY